MTIKSDDIWLVAFVALALYVDSQQAYFCVLLLAVMRWRREPKP